MLAMLWTVAALAGSEVHVDQLTANGLEIRDVSCSLTSGGLFASLEVVGALAAQKEALDACHPAGAAFRASWRWVDGTTHDATVTASSTPAADACVTAALGAVQSRLGGTCTAVVLVGDATAAAAAAAALPPPATK